MGEGDSPKVRQLGVAMTATVEEDDDDELDVEQLAPTERDAMLADVDKIEVVVLNGDDDDDVVETMVHIGQTEDVDEEATKMTTQVKDPKSNTEIPTSRRNGTAKNGGSGGDMEIEVDVDSTMSKEVRTDGESWKPSLKERLVPTCLQDMNSGRCVILGVAFLLFALVTIVVVGILVSPRIPMYSGSATDDDGGGGGPYAGRTHVETMTHCGRVEGLVQHGSLAFYGIPYSVPPIGPLRWKPSELVQRLEDCWTDVYRAHKPKPLCYQRPLSKPFEHLQFSEDCLYLDVFTPRATYNDPMPVVVYFAGDSFQGHDAVDVQWRPSARLAREKGVVFVVVYYRMNAFGFLALELLTKSVHPPTSGNYGLHDMLTALKWVHRNVDSFGGDPAKVTLLGHGSGATGVVALLSSRLARLLFNQAWITGGSAHVVNKTLREVERNNEAFNRHLMCDTTECLYNKTAEQILNAIPVSEWPFWGVPNHLDLPTNDEHTAAIAVVDGTILYDVPSVVWENNDFVDVALVVGSSLHSVASELVDDDLGDMDWSGLNATVKSKLGTFGANVVVDVLRHYLHPNDDDVENVVDNADGDGEVASTTTITIDRSTTPLEAYVTMLSDLRVTCPLLNLAYRASKAFTNNVYFYLSTYVPDGAVRFVNLSDKRMAAHGLDVAAIFNLLPSVLSNGPTAADLAYQRTVQDMFYTFVERGRPSTTAAGVNPKMPWTMNYVSDVLDSSPTRRYTNCDFWTRHGMYPRHGRTN